ncbi:MAG TPA: PEP-utilizing enzyme [Phycisphaerae bacterium]|nr:PEP-utilizing enzyme [Phycisphaerae bacterium]HRY70949.1 PEP-utilizing enzyme [Phycisphaerae bacterium]HSA29190.1 PEP-utilizing enzyme [Phycisphaerae bacterium]
MGAGQRFVIPLAEVTNGDEPLVGGKAARLAALFAEHIDVACGAERLSDRPELTLHGILELAGLAAAESRQTTVSAKASPSAETPRQLVGQPAAPGLQTGRVRRVRTAEGLGQFQAGEVLVCDAIQPMMTHLVPLACAVVEQRGGMLIHGAIIARELGIPCVNGVAGVIEMLRDGEIVTVDGYLGIVTVGTPDFDLGLADAVVGAVARPPEGRT